MFPAQLKTMGERNGGKNWGNILEKQIEDFLSTTDSCLNMKKKKPMLWRRLLICMLIDPFLNMIKPETRKDKFEATNS
jgi:hypothetical protein